MGGEIAAWVGAVVGGIVFVASIVASQVSLHLKLTRLATCLEQIGQNDLPHLKEKLDAMLAECVERGKAGVARDGRIDSLERWRQRRGSNPGAAVSEPEQKGRSNG